MLPETAVHRREAGVCRENSAGDLEKESREDVLILLLTCSWHPLQRCEFEWSGYRWVQIPIHSVSNCEVCVAPPGSGIHDGHGRKGSLLPEGYDRHRDRNLKYLVCDFAQESTVGVKMGGLRQTGWRRSRGDGIHVVLSQG